MKKRRLILLILTILAFAGLVVITTQFEAGIKKIPQPLTQLDRIVSMAPNLTEILFALGLEDNIAGVTIHSDYPPAAEKKPKMGTFWQPNIEAVIAAKPDLVITLGFEQQRNLAKRLKASGCGILTVNIEKVSDLFGAIEKIGEATNTTQKADQLILNIKKELGGLAAMFDSTEKIRVLWVIQTEPLRVAGRSTFVNEIITLAGGENAIGPTLHQYPPIGTEQLYSCGADVIITPAQGREELSIQQQKALKFWSRFKSVPAVKNQRIYVIDPGPVSRLGPRLPKAVKNVAECLRPELFDKK